MYTPSSIKLFGRLIAEIQIVGSPHAPRLGDNNFFNFANCRRDPPPQLARIYAFSYEGAYYELPRPPIFACSWALGSR